MHDKKTRVSTPLTRKRVATRYKNIEYILILGVENTYIHTYIEKENEKGIGKYIEK